MSGLAGPPGPKSSIIKTELGNVAFACTEGARPVFMDQLRGVGLLALRPKFLASIVPGSAFVWSLHSSDPEAAAEMAGDSVRIEAVSPATIIIAGIDRRFPDWDMPLVSDAQLKKSTAWWGKEWL